MPKMMRFRVKPYAHRKYKFLVRGKVLGKWRRRYFVTEAEAIAFAEQQNAKVPKKNGDASFPQNGARPRWARPPRDARSMATIDTSMITSEEIDESYRSHR